MHRHVDRIARWFALLGGSVLSILIVLTCFSIIGRSLHSVLNSDFMQTTLPELANALLTIGVGPINGDFELVEAGIAFAIFSFLPLCQLNGAHASVDIFTSKLPVQINRYLRMIIEIVFALVIVLIAWQHFLGMLSKYNSGQTTFLIQFPVWWAYAFSLAGAIAAAFISIYIAAMRMMEVATNRVLLPNDISDELEVER